MPDEPSSPLKKSPLRRAAGVAKLLFTPVAVAFILWAGWMNRQSLASTLQTALWGRLALSALLWAAAHFAAPIMACLVLSGGSFKLDYLSAYDIHAKNLPARYIPGGVWHSVGRVAAFHALGAPARRLILFVFLENSLAPATGFLFGGLIVTGLRGLAGWGGVGAAGAAVGAAALLALPAIGRRFVLGGEPFPTAVFIKACGAMILFWAGIASSFTVFVSAFPDAFSRLAPISVAGTYMFSWAAGNLAIFAPQGIGVFETVAAGILNGSLSVGAAAALLVAFRGVALVSDAGSFLLARLVVMILRNREKNEGGRPKRPM
ncbi:MAG: hypothetical protein HZB23_13445 [Deltaproteobacteria bacterium]|nr:hypothetical protein [Deltaproteobacteria bacterium]